MSSGAKRHHQVPQFYLQRFAVGGKVLVRWRDGKQYTTSPFNVAVESGYYDIPDGAGGVSKEIEDGLADVETHASAVLRNMDATGVPPGGRDPDSATLAMFVGLMAARTTDHRERVMFPQRVIEWANGRALTREVVEEYLQTVHLGFKPEADEVEGAHTVVQLSNVQAPETLTQEFAVEMMLRSAWEISRRLLGLHWSLEHDPRGEFVTSDTPVVLWRKPSAKDEYMGFGVETATEVRIPLDPGKQLVMSRRPRKSSIDVQMHRVRAANKAMSGAAHKFIVGSPDSAQVAAQRLRAVRPVIRFSVGKGYETGPDGVGRPMRGAILHMWTPRDAEVGRLRRGPVIKPGDE
jgi:hypothetical protein